MTVWHIGMNELSGETHVTVDPWRWPSPDENRPMVTLCDRVIPECLPPDLDFPATVTCEDCRQLLHDHRDWCDAVVGDPGE